MKSRIIFLKVIINTIAIIIYCYASLLFPQQRKIDSLFKALSVEKIDTGKVKILHALSAEFNHNNPDTALIIDLRALKLSEELNWKKGIAKSLELLGSHHYSKGDYSSAMENYSASLEVYERLNDKTGTAVIFSNIGLVYKQWGEHSDALDYYFKALKINEEIKNKHGIALNLGNVGLVFMNQREYNKALDYFTRALKIDENEKNKPGIARHLGNIGIIHKYLKDYPKALDCFTKALAMNEEMGRKSGIANNLGNIGIIYEEQGNSQKALEYYFKTLKIYEKSGNKKSIAHTLANIGSHISKVADTLPSTTVRNTKYREAEKYLKRALGLAEEAGALREINTASRNLTNLYDKTDRYQLALTYYKKYIATRDSIFNEENTKEQTQIEMQYEFDKKEAAAKAEQEKKDALSAAEKRKQNIILWAVGAGLILVLAFALFIFRSYRQKQKANIEIILQKQIIEEKQREVLDSIYYASRIQRSLLPSEKKIARILKTKKPS